MIQPFGSAVTMTCTVELSPVVNVQMIVTTVWTGPAGFMTTKTAQSVMGSTTNYTSTAMVSSFRRNESGVYSCSATATTTSPFLRSSASHSGTTRITVGKRFHYIMHVDCQICMLWVDGMKDLWCSSRIRLLSTQIQMEGSVVL